jgi:hypothetical protein
VGRRSGEFIVGWRFFGLGQ